VVGEIGDVNIDKSYGYLSKQNRECIMLRIIYRKSLNVEDSR